MSQLSENCQCRTSLLLDREGLPNSLLCLLHLGRVIHSPGHSRSLRVPSLHTRTPPPANHRCCSSPVLARVDVDAAEIR